MPEGAENRRTSSRWGIRRGEADGAVSVPVDAVYRFVSCFGPHGRTTEPNPFAALCVVPRRGGVHVFFCVRTSLISPPSCFVGLPCVRCVCLTQVSCGKHFFAAVTHGGGLHTWGLDASDGRLGHGAAVVVGSTAAAAAAAAAPAAAPAAVAGGGAAAREGAGINAAERAFWLKAPARVEALSRERVVQVVTRSLCRRGGLLFFRGVMHVSRYASHGEPAAPAESRTFSPRAPPFVRSFVFLSFGFWRFLAARSTPL